MMIHSTRSSLCWGFLAVWWLVATTSPCLAQDGEFNHRYIIEFQDSEQGTHSKQRLLKSKDDNDANVQVIGHIARRNIAIVKFSSREAAEEWKVDQKEDIRLMEEGE